MAGSDSEQDLRKFCIPQQPFSDLQLHRIPSNHICVYMHIATYLYIYIIYIIYQADAPLDTRHSIYTDIKLLLVYTIHCMSIVRHAPAPFKKGSMSWKRWYITSCHGCLVEIFGHSQIGQVIAFGYQALLIQEELRDP